MTLKDELLFLAEMFEGDDKKHLIKTAYCGDEEKMKAVIYQAEQILDGRSK